jgi:hypothetical protein
MASTVVFVGKATEVKVQQVSLFLGEACVTTKNGVEWLPCPQNVSINANFVAFDVSEQFKGPHAVARILVATEQHTAACGYPFEIGGEYLVYAYADDDGVLWTSICSRTTTLEMATDDLAILRTQLPIDPDVEARADLDYYGPRVEKVVFQGPGVEGPDDNGTFAVRPSVDGPWGAIKVVATIESDAFWAERYFVLTTTDALFDSACTDVDYENVETGFWDPIPLPGGVELESHVIRVRAPFEFEMFTLDMDEFMNQWVIPQGGSPWPWALRVRVMAVDRYGGLLRDGTGILEMLPPPIVSPCNEGIDVTGTLSTTDGPLEGCELTLRTPEGERAMQGELHSEPIAGAFSEMLVFSPHRNHYRIGVECPGYDLHLSEMFDVNDYVDPDRPLNLGRIELHRE